jgi:streptogramin lyase
MITETAVPNNQMPRHIDVAPNGAVWFTEPDANQVVRYQPTTHIFTNFAYNLADGAPDQIEVLNNTSVWITAPGVNRVAELQVGGGNYVNIPVSDIGSPTFPAGGLALDESGPWITAPTADRIGRYAPGTIAFWNWYAMPLVPNNLTYTGNVNNKTLWFTSTDSGRVGRLLLDNQGRIKSFGIHTLPTLDSEPIAVAVDDDGVAWITESGGNKIASWQPPYFYEWFLPVVRKGE